MLSVIIPTFNEVKHGILKKALSRLSQIEGAEVIVVDNFSNDGTAELVKESGHKLIQIQANSRAERMNHGIRAARHEMLLLHHPRSLLTREGLEFLRDNPSLEWGAFTHRFDNSHPLLKFTSWYSNLVRGDLRAIYYLDHCLYVRKSLLEKVGLIPEVDIFEDTLICLKLRKLARPKRLPFVSQTSAIRFEKNGLAKQILLNQKLKLAFYLKRNHRQMNKQYEKEMGLNSEYKD